MQINYSSRKEIHSEWSVLFEQDLTKEQQKTLANKILYNWVPDYMDIMEGEDGSELYIECIFTHERFEEKAKSYVLDIVTKFEEEIQ